MANPNKDSPLALTIAGSDSSCGAGVQADLKAFSVAEVYGASVITCVTAQNTLGVLAIEPLPPKIVNAQLDAVLEDLKPRAIKTGMLYSKEILLLVTEKLKGYLELMTEDDENFKLRLVVDPVLQATTGAKLTKGQRDNENLLALMKHSLFPIATVITPNIPETEQILGWKCQSYEELQKACRELYKFGPKYVLLKGGHAANIMDVPGEPNEIVDLLYNGELQTFRGTRIDKDVHGTGCTFSALITGFLARGYKVPQAVGLAKNLIETGIRNSSAIGKGVDVLNLPKIQHHWPQIGLEKEKFKVHVQVLSAVDELTGILTPYFLPEVGINLGYALPHATSSDEICALTGRLVRVGNSVDYLGDARFGASKHVARIILTAMKNDETVRSAMNIKYRPEVIQECEKLNLIVGSFNRSMEPGDTSSMEWGTNEVIKDLGRVPDIIFDTGGIGKEPMIRILGKDPNDVLGKVRKIIENLN